MCIILPKIRSHSVSYILRPRFFSPPEFRRRLRWAHEPLQSISAAFWIMKRHNEVKVTIMLEIEREKNTEQRAAFQGTHFSCNWSKKSKDIKKKMQGNSLFATQRRKTQLLVVLWLLPVVLWLQPFDCFHCLFLQLFILLPTYWDWTITRGTLSHKKIPVF